jgi:hypothetical protein
VCCETGASSGGTEQVSAARSQPYYLDVTHPHANKGFVIERLSQMLAIPTQEIATIGDMPQRCANVLEKWSEHCDGQC